MYLIGGDVDHLSVHGNVLVIHNLSCFPSCAGKAHAEHDIVETALEHDHQVLTGLALHHISLLIVVVERLLQNAVDELCLLLLAELQAVLGNLAASAGQRSLGLLVIAEEAGFQLQGSASLQYGSLVNCHFQ